MDAWGYVLRMKRRWVANGLPDYPMWVAALIDSAALATAVGVVVQRLGHDDLWLSVALTLLALSPWPVELWSQGRNWPAFSLVTGAATAGLLASQQLDYDIAPLFLVLATGHVTACVGLKRGLITLASGFAVLVGLVATGALPVAAAAVWTAALVVAVDIGFVLRSQQLRLQAQAREHVAREQQAVLEERQRIAREVHDLVAHSLSVTMLHLTAARRDLEEGVDTAEAADALREAERVGRQAVSDVRRTVGLLGAGGAVDPPAPTVEDIALLVAEFRAAGMDVGLVTAGDLAQVPPATGLGLYRIVQESLTNVARHSPRSPVTVMLDVAADPGRLEIRNRLPDDAVRGAGGSGLTGMAHRAGLLGASLSAGRQDDDWVVCVELPRGDTVRHRGGRTCPLPRAARPNLRTT